jgi:hypothetical protein
MRLGGSWGVVQKVLVPGHTGNRQGLAGQGQLDKAALGAPGWSLGQRMGATDSPLTVNRRQLAARHGPVLAEGHMFRVLAAPGIGFPIVAGNSFLLRAGTFCALNRYHGVPAIKVWNGPPAH